MKGEIQHFSHKHPLSLVPTPIVGKCTETWDGLCKICARKTTYPSYGCLECWFFIHPTCSEIPEKIHHFLHPCSEPLTLLDYGDSFVQDGCPLCDQTTNEKSSVTCYYCNKCKFKIHNFCSQFAEELQHRLHPCTLTIINDSSAPSNNPNLFCNACFQVKDYQVKLKCKPCGFHMHHDCALLPSTLSGGENNQGEILHFTHLHPLRLVDVNNKERQLCSICRQLCSDVAYCCKNCDFFLHQSCLNKLKQTIQHPLHPHHPLILQTTAKSCCNWCGYSIERGFVYRCGLCNFNLDIVCATTSLANREDVLRIKHFYHPHHPLEVLNHHDIKVKHRRPEATRCWACREYSPSPEICCYKCNFFLHLSCASNSSPQKLRLEDDLFHQDHNLQIRDCTNHKKDHFKCISCGLKDVDGNFLAYYCVDCPEFVMHVGCAQLRPSIKYVNHKHLLTFFKKRGDPGLCLICREPCNKFFLRCVICRISLHLQCHPLAPETVEHKYHRHPLTRTKSPLEYDLKEFGKLDEYYCDFCEEPRPASDPVYSCKNPNCMISTEVGCVFSLIFDPVTAKITKADDGEGSSCRDDPEAEKLGSEINLLSSNYRHNVDKRNKAKKEIESLKRQILELDGANSELSEKIEKLVQRRFSHFASNPATF